MTVDDGTAECRLWSAGETLTKGVLRMAPSVLTEVQNAAMRLGPQTYSAAAEDDLTAAHAGSLHSRRSMAFQKFLSGGAGVGMGRRLHVLVRYAVVLLMSPCAHHHAASQCCGLHCVCDRCPCCCLIHSFVLLCRLSCLMGMVCRPPPPQDPTAEYEMRPVTVWTGDRFPMQKRPPTVSTILTFCHPWLAHGCVCVCVCLQHLRAVAAEAVKTIDYARRLLSNT